MEIVYGTLVKVIIGFYVGCTGIVDSQDYVKVDTYKVRMTCKDANGQKDFPSEWFDKNQLEIIKRP